MIDAAHPPKRGARGPKPGTVGKELPAGPCDKPTRQLLHRLEDRVTAGFAGAVVGAERLVRSGVTAHAVRRDGLEGTEGAIPPALTSCRLNDTEQQVQPFE